MNKLFVFGCSHTYGHGLPDCLGEDNAPGPSPSKMGWAQKTGDLLGKEVINKGECGSSNKEILWNFIQNIELIDPAHDTLIIQWSYFERTMIIKHDPDSAEEFYAHKLAPWSTHKDNKIYYKYLHSEIDDICSTALYINHAYMLTKHYNFKKVAMSTPPDSSGTTEYYKKKFNDILLSEVELIEKNVTDYEIDRASDGIHAGVKTNQLYAEKLAEHYGHILR